MNPLDLKLADGTPVRIRSVVPDDRYLLDAALHRVSSDTLRLRFHSSGFRASEATMDYLTRVDHKDHIAVCAVTTVAAGEVGIGVARCIRNPARPDEAELAVTVSDPYQHRGVGAALVGALASRAEEQGMDTFIAFIEATRRPLILMLRRLGARVRTSADGVSELELSIRTAARLFRRSIQSAA